MNGRDLTIAIDGIGGIGEGRELDSATVPIQWFFSKEVAEKKPTHVFVVEQTESEGSDPCYSHQLGRRYLCKVGDVIKYIPLHSPGYHRVIVIILAHPIDEKILKQYIGRWFEQEKTNWYERSVSWTNPADGFGNWFIASATIDFSVPEELFAQKPAGVLGKALWRWGNLFFEKDPVDECHFRKRLIFAFTLQSILCFVGWTIYFGILGGINAILGVLGRLLYLFFGYRTNPILKELWLALKMKKFSVGHLDRETIGYRVWEKKQRKWGEFFRPVAYMPITGIELALFLIPFAFLYPQIFATYLPPSSIEWIYFLVAETIGFPIFTAIFLVWLERATGILGYLATVKLPKPELGKYLPLPESWSRAYQSIPPVVKPVGRLAKNWLNAFGSWLFDLRDRYYIWLDKKEEEWREKARVTATVRTRSYQDWLKTSFVVAEPLPKVDIKRLPRPRTAPKRAALRLRVSFHALKAKVCRPYPKS